MGQMVAAASPLIVQLRVVDFEKDVYSTIRVVEAGK